ncbi:MAG: lytic transglycosylase domain-containing protein [Spirochaetaceae bacterium]|nr:lytic transglycosylase domain-containing protein [Spirochaetaceae bacterium]
MKKYLVIFLSLIVFGSCYSSELNHNRIWNVELKEFESRLLSKDYEFLSQFDFSRLEKRDRLKEIYKMHKGGAFFLSFIFETLGQRENQILFLKIEMLEGQWKREAAEKLYDLLSREKEWDKLSEYLKLYFTGIEENKETLPLLIEALYKSHQYKEALFYSGPDFLSLYTLQSMILMEDLQWIERLKFFLYSGASSEDIDHLYNYLTERDLMNSIGETEKLYIRAISSYYRNKFDAAQVYLKELQFSRETYRQYPSLLYSLRLPIQQTGLEEIWVKRFLSDFSFASTFTVARLYLHERKFDLADDLYRKAITLAETDYEEDRARWYLMDLYRNNIFHFSALVEEFAPLWHDPQYFNDVLEDFLALVSSRGEWSLFNKVYPYIPSYGDDEIIAAYSWVKYLAIESGSLPEDNREILLDRMIKSTHLSFYNLMGTVLSGGSLTFDESCELLTEYSDADDLLSGFFAFSLSDEALLYSSGVERHLNRQTLRRVSQYAADQGQYLRSIQLLNYISLDSGQKYSLGETMLMFPPVYEELILTYSNENAFPGEIFSGIIRTESAFTHDIISHAGAVGLSQLMPATAEEHARKIGILNPDLTDPETNIHIGSSYVRWIQERDWSENLSQMLIAYNAGGGNLRKWKRIYPGYREELFVEVLPYKETRNYVKKVLASSVIYGSVYKNQKAEDIIRKIYPDLSSLKLQ